MIIQFTIGNFLSFKEREVKTITFPFRKNELEGTIPYGGVRYARKRNDSINGR